MKEVRRAIQLIRQSGAKPAPETQEISLQDIFLSDQLNAGEVNELVQLMKKSLVKNSRQFLMIVTEEDDRYPEKGLGWFGEHPEEGSLVDIIVGDTYEELTRNGEYEGLFYLLFNRQTGKKISSGIIDPDGLEEELEENR